MEKKNLEFSVLMSVYKNDKAEYVKQSIESILNQTVKPKEIILIVDGPIPNDIKDLIMNYAKNIKEFHITFLEKNVGLGNALNIGLDKCSCDIVARMDADDISVIDRFEKQIKEFEQDDTLSIVGGYISEFIENVEESVGIRKVPLNKEEISIFLKNRNPFNHMTVMFKKQSVLDAGSYQDFFYYEDYYLWVRMFLKNMDMKNINSVLVNARVGADMYKRRGGWKFYKSGVKFQKYLLSNKLITFPKYIINILIRFIIQVLMPNKVREVFYKKVARKK